MKLWYKACPRCQGDLVSNTDIGGVPYVTCMQCGMELTPLQEATLRRFGYVRDAEPREAPPVMIEGWRRWKAGSRTG